MDIKLFSVYFLTIVMPFLGASNAHAQKTCDSLLSDIKLTIDATKSDKDPRFLQKHYLQATRKVQALAIQAGLLFPNSPIKILMNPGINAGSPANIRRRAINEIIVTMHFQRIFDSSLRPSKSHPDGFFTKHPIYTLAEFFHEIGHAIFRQNVSGSDSPLGVYFSIDLELQDIQIKSKPLFEKWDKPSSQEEKEMADAQLTELKKRFDELKIKEFEYEASGQKHIFDALNELFADITAVLTSENPSAIADSTYIKGMPKKFWRYLDHQTHRDFADPSNELNVWKARSEIHDYFAPVRYFIFQHYLRYPSYLTGAKKHFLYKKLLNDMIEFSKTQMGDIKDPKEMNRRLISVISSAP